MHYYRRYKLLLQIQAFIYRLHQRNFRMRFYYFPKDRILLLKYAIFKHFNMFMQLQYCSFFFLQAIQYLEGAYADVQASGGDKEVIIQNAKSIVTKGLLTVINDIEKASNALSQLVDIQSIAVSSSISSTIDFIDQRLSDVREQQSVAELHELKCNSLKALNPAAVIDIDSSKVSTVFSETTSFRRVSLEQRFPIIFSFKKYILPD